MKIKVYNKTYAVFPVKGKYLNNDTLAIMLKDADGYPFASLTVNIEASDFVASDRRAFVDVNNCPWAEEFIKDNYLGIPTGKIGFSGYCKYPLYEFNINLLYEE